MKTTESNRMIAEFMGKDKSVVFTSYDKDWNALMPVVEKIEGIGVTVIIGRMFCDIEYSDPLNKDKNFDVRIASGVKMNAVNGAVTEFIKWYNEAQ